MTVNTSLYLLLIKAGDTDIDSLYFDSDQAGWYRQQSKATGTSGDLYLTGCAQEVY
jgi:hypothetical protein